MVRVKAILSVFFIVCLGTARANDVLISVLHSEVSTDTVYVDLELSWENSWTPSNAQNHDAVWLIAKHKIGNDWVAVYPVTSSSQDYLIKETTDQTGLIIRGLPQSDDFQSGQLRVGFLITEVKPLAIYFGAIEVVAVNQGSFVVGDSLSFHTLGTPNNRPLRIEAENQLDSTMVSSTKPESVLGNIPPGFPKGYEGFYCMKYELSQGQIVDFMNHLSYPSQKTLFSQIDSLAIGDYLFGNKGQNFGGIRCSRPASDGWPAVFISDLSGNMQPGDPADGETLACNFISWSFLLTYLDWAGLRPMTELEFEKACRGTVPSSPREFAFGSPFFVDANTTTLDGTAFETYLDTLPKGAGILVSGFTGRFGPLRTGFAASKQSNRLESGASYWGIMELSGNLWEQTVSVAKPNGLSFEGSHGDGNLTNGWPSDWKTEASIVRGGAWNSGLFLPYRDLAVSDRYYYGLASERARNTTGGRGVRSFKTLLP